MANKHEEYFPFLRITAHVSGKNSFLMTSFKILFLNFASFVVGGKDKPMDEA